jgi:hypothetical protein
MLEGCIGGPSPKKSAYRHLAFLGFGQGTTFRAGPAFRAASDEDSTAQITRLNRCDQIHLRPDSGVQAT